MIQKPKKKLNKSQVFLLVLLFAGMMNLFNLFFYFVVVLFVFSVFFNYRHIKIDRMTVLLLAFSLCYLLFLPNSRNSVMAVLKQFAYPMCYLVGLNFIKRDTQSLNPDAEEFQQSAAIIIVSMGAFTHYFANILSNADNFMIRNVIDIWTGELLSATGQAGLAVLAVGVFVSLLFFNNNKLISAISFAGIVFIFASNLTLAGRTLLFLILLTLIIAFVIVYKSSNNTNKTKMMLFVTVTVTILTVIYYNNLWGIRDMVIGSTFSKRFEQMSLFEDNRFFAKLQYIKLFLDYPFGGRQLFTQVGSYAHELYLDVYSDVGILGYLIVIVFVISSCSNIWKKARASKSNGFRLLIYCVYFNLLSIFFLEPIIQGMPWCFCAFCFFSGLFGRNKRIKRRKQY